MSSGSIYKTLDVTVKKVLVNLRSNWEKEDTINHSDSNLIFKENLYNIIQLNSLEPNKEEYFRIIREINSFLSNTKKLTNQQKLDYCKTERYFMKLYLKEFDNR
ncbi:MAG: hypothetical protein ACFFBP_19390 [Promethearchaeota archaeon]